MGFVNKPGKDGIILTASSHSLAGPTRRNRFLGNYAGRPAGVGPPKVFSDQRTVHRPDSAVPTATPSPGKPEQARPARFPQYPERVDWAGEVVGKY